jgi:hypothetical protein
MSQTKKSSVDFIGVGAEKAGSTWVADMLRQHPEVFVPEKKEVYFFNEYDPHFLKVKNPKYEWGLGWYLDHFKEVEKDVLTGEFSPTYLYSRSTAERIYSNFPKVKTFIVIRDPIERAFSQYIQDKRFGLLDGLSFSDAIKENDTYIEKGLYYKHISSYLKIFPRKNVKIILLDDIKSEPEKIIREVFIFLKLREKSYRPKFLRKKSNSAQKARFIGLNKFMISREYALRNSRFRWLLKPLEGSGVRTLAIKIRELNSVDYKSYPRSSKSNKEKLYKYFEDDIKNLEKLLGRNLKKWRY